MKEDKPIDRRKRDAVNFLAGDFNILPPKIPSKPSNRKETKLLKVRIIPGWDQDGKENTQLNQAMAAKSQEVTQRDYLLGDWVYKNSNCYSIRHFNKETREETFSWFSGYGYRDVGKETLERTLNPEGRVCRALYFENSAFRQRRKQLYEQHGFGSEKAHDVQKKEFNLGQCLMADCVSPPLKSPEGVYFIQVIPLSLGSEKLDYENTWGRTLLPVQQYRFREALLKLFTENQEDKEGLPLTPENSQLGYDVVSLENGKTLSIQGNGTAGIIKPGELYRLGPDDGWMDPVLKAWIPWDDVFDKYRPGELLRQLAAVTSPAAVDWALSGTSDEDMIPDTMRGAGEDFSLAPKPVSTSESFENNPVSEGKHSEDSEPKGKQEKTESKPVPNPTKPEQQTAPSASSSDVHIDEDVQNEVNAKLKAMEESLKSAHNSQEDADKG